MISLVFPTTVDLFTAKVKIGDIVRYTLEPDSDPLFPNAANFDGILKVGSVDSKTTLSIQGYNIDGTAADLTLDDGVASTTVFTIVHLYTKDEQAQLIADTAKSIASKRTIMNWPPAGEVDVVDASGVTVTHQVDGSFISTCFAAAKSAQPAQQSFTDFEFAGPTRLKYSNDYFNPRQLKLMSKSGVNVFVQSVEGGKIHSIHQHSTDVSVFENAEISMTTVEDKVSLDLIATLRPFKGKYNITDNYLNLLSETATRYFFKAKNNAAPICGPLIINGKVLSVRASLDGKNTDLGDGEVEMVAKIERGKPGNWVNIKLLV